MKDFNKSTSTRPCKGSWGGELELVRRKLRRRSTLAATGACMFDSNRGLVHELNFGRVALLRSFAGKVKSVKEDEHCMQG